MPDTKPQRQIPWIAHFIVLALAMAAVAFAAPFLLPLVAMPLAMFGALSTVLFPLCRGSWRLFVLNYVICAVIAIALYFTD